jgi:valyl-tRNA synthetase
MNQIADKIPNRFEFQTACDAIYSAWEADGCFHAEVNRNRRPFTIVIPPPNVTGALHLGHALNNTLQDIQVRWHRMRGFEALWMPGTDHAGIATQAVVEKRLKQDENKTRHDLGREELVSRIWKWKDEYEARILNQLRRMGCSCDWQRTRFTLDAMCARAVRATFFDLFRQSLIYRGKRLVNWDTFLQTAVSDDEVFHQQVKGHFWHFRYPVIDPLPGEPTHVTIATTRPETMLGDTAVAVHPDPESAFSQVESQLQLKLSESSAKDRPAVEQQVAAMQARRTSHLPMLKTLSRMAERGARLRLPLVEREIPLIADEWAKPDLGSGCVKITPAHDPNDYEVGLRCQLPMINILNPDGTLNSAAGKYQGLPLPKARKAVCEDLEALGLVEEVEDRDIDLAHSDRSKTPIEPYLADQWFVRMEQLAQQAMDAVTDGRVQIHPERYAKGYLDWLSEKRDWPVGRQLWWGHQIPIWSQSFDSPESAKEQVERWNALPEVEQGRLRADLELPSTVHICVRNEADPLEAELEAQGYARQEDVLDTWFSSALWPHSTLGWPEKTAELEYFYPTSTLITSRDIITLWVARMVLMGLNNLGKVPFRDVYIHPKILDGYGETMSKSKGNGVDPIDVIEKFGPDALRFGLAWLATETQDVRMPVQFECPHCGTAINQTQQNRESPTIKCHKCHNSFSTQWAKTAQEKALPRGPVISERFEVARNFCNKLWNAARFVMMHLEGYQPQQLDWSSLPLEDRWILSRLSSTTQAVTQGLQKYEFADAARAIYDFAWDEFCSYYVEMAKPRLQDAQSRAATQQVLIHALDHLLRLLHPFIPYITEAIWQELVHFGSQRTLPSSQPSGSQPSGSSEVEGHGTKETKVLGTHKWLMLSDWPEAELAHQDREIESQFSQFVAVVTALRELRSSQNIPPKDEISFTIACDSSSERLLRPMDRFFLALAKANCVGMGSQPNEPEVAASVAVESMKITVDLGKLINFEAEIARNEKLAENLAKQIQGKKSKLSNASFVERAPVEVVDKERQSLTELESQLVSVEAALQKLRATSKTKPSN